MRGSGIRDIDVQGPLKFAPEETRQLLRDSLDKVRPYDAPGYEDHEPRDDPPQPPQLLVNMQKLEEDVNKGERDRLKDLAALLHELTFIQMMTHAQGICMEGQQPHEVANRLHGWADGILNPPPTPDVIEGSTENGDTAAHAQLG